ncbi:MAG: carbohydrate ABC transporter substrate-binding protein [Lachnospiraceae bacterium]|nr:carbohydrate ABC transporter substrate-binding protein [Lachnospiraceae bacterium]
MRKHILPTSVLMLCLLLTACGTKGSGDDAGNIGSHANNGSAGDTGVGWQGVTTGMDLTEITDRTEYYDLTVEEELFDLGLWAKNRQDMQVQVAAMFGDTGYIFLGMQFYKGEPVQLWDEESGESARVLLYGKDGNSKVLLQEAPAKYTAAGAVSSSGYKWYLDGEGNLYCYCTNYISAAGKYRAQGCIVKIPSSGEILYETNTEQGTAIEDLCQTEDGRIYVLARDERTDTRYVVQMDPDTGKLIPESQVELPVMEWVHLGSDGEFPALIGTENFDRKVMKVNTADGSLETILSFTGTSYGWHDDLELRNFRVLGDGSVHLLWVYTNSYAQSNGKDFLIEKLKMEKVEKIPVVLRGVFSRDDWVAKQAAAFNRKNDTYHVVIEDCGAGNDAEDFARLTSIQVSAGKGPDILCGSSLLGDYVSGMMEKGALEELNSYMEASGVREEEYFPLVFSTWRQGEKIYGVNPRMNVIGYQMDERVLGGRGTPDIEALVDALLAQEEDGVYYRGADSGQVLRMFLEGTDSLWGMVDWENGACDFQTPLFEKLLEAARRHGDNGRKNPESCITTLLRFDNVIQFDGSAEQEADGMVTCGVLFDDGCHAVSDSPYTMAVNANSSHKEGAWEFIRFLIGEEVQGTDFEWYKPPVHKEIFEQWMQEKVIVELTQIRYVNGVKVIPGFLNADVSEEKQEEYRKALEEAASLPMRTAPILDIIREEAGSYFDGSKSAEQVSGVINNRVQLYLDEIH